MLKYFGFAVKFLFSYYWPKKYDYYGNLPFYKTVALGTVAKVQCGGEFRYIETYVRTTSGWLKFESEEETIKNSKEYLQRQDEIKQELQKVKEETSATS